jgi:phosphoribosyl 1,2-cyclic phosphodiesterase
MENPNFPVSLGAMGAKMIFRDLAEGEPVVLDDGEGDEVRVTSAQGNHPQGVRAYRVEHRGKSMVYATDTEHYAGRVDESLLKLSKDVDVLIYDAQYTPEEYSGTAGTGGPKKGWGHSTFEEGAKLAKLAGAKRFILFHHDPIQSDAAVREKEKRARALFPDVVAAHEGLTIDL